MYYISRMALAHKSERDPEGREGDWQIALVPSILASGSGDSGQEREERGKGEGRKASQLDPHRT